MAELDRPLKNAFSGEGLPADGDAAKGCQGGLARREFVETLFGNVRRRTWTSSLNAADAYLSTS